MIKAEKLSFSFPQKDLYQDISFTIEEGQHCAFIGSNGTGKSTLIDMIRDPERYLFDGKLELGEEVRIGYVSQFFQMDHESQTTVFQFLSETFVTLQAQIEKICEEMGSAEDFDEVMERYQAAMDAFAAVDGDHYESNIKKQLKTAGLAGREDLKLSLLSGGEYKLVQILKEMLVLPDLLIMDEPDGFLDFENLNGLKNLINSYSGTILAVTHNRYLLNHCFNKILHLENAGLQEFEGSYTDYRFAMLQTKLERQEAAAKDEAEIQRNEKLVNKLRANATKFTNSANGRALNARVSLLERLKAKQIQTPFLELREPEIELHAGNHEKAASQAADAGTEEVTEAAVTRAVEEATENAAVTGAVEEATGNAAETEAAEAAENKENPSILRVSDYRIAYDDVLLDHVTFEMGPTDKAALVGPNGTGKTTLLRDLYRSAVKTQNEGQKPAGGNDSIWIDETCRTALVSQLPGETMDEEDKVVDLFLAPTAQSTQARAELAALLERYCLGKELLDQQVKKLSGGERNLLQLARISTEPVDLLLLDEPTSHLDLYAQLALEKAIREYDGAMLMVSHDFYTIAGCVDYVLYVENGGIRRMSVRAFRKLIYASHFDKDYLELEQKKKELENRIEAAIKASDLDTAKILSEQLAAIIDQMER